jgi:hypothetical protein
LEAIFFVMITRICLLLLYSGLMYKYETCRNVFMKYCGFLAVSVVLCVVGLGIGGADYEEEYPADFRFTPDPSHPEDSYDYPKLGPDWHPIEKELTAEGQIRLILLWTLVIMEICMYVAFPLNPNSNPTLTRPPARPPAAAAGRFRHGCMYVHWMRS